MMEVRTKFSLASRKLLRVLIIDQSKENLTSPSVVEEIEQDARNHAYCRHYNDKYCIEFSIRRYVRRYVDGTACKISSECQGVLLGRTWIAERHATYNTVTRLLKLKSCGQWYGLTTIPQQFIPKEPPSSEISAPKEDSKEPKPSSEENVPHEYTQKAKVENKQGVSIEESITYQVNSLLEDKIEGVENQLKDNKLLSMEA